MPRRDRGREARERTTRRAGLLAAIALTGMASCGGDGTGTSEPLSVHAVDLAGAWTLSLPAAPGCMPSLAAFDLALELRPYDLAGVHDTETREFLDGTWTLAGGDPGSHWLQGWVEPDRRRVYLVLWDEVHVAGSVLDLDMATAAVGEGWLKEPVPAGPGGFAQPAESYPGTFTTGACRWRVAAAKSGS